MKSSKTTKVLLSTILVLMLVLVQLTFADDTAAAQANTAQPDIPSDWAAFDIQMATVYKLGGANNYTGYADAAADIDIDAIEASLYSSFEITDKDVKFDEGLQNREAVVKGLFEVLKNVLSIKMENASAGDNAEAYFIEKGILKGRGNGNALDQVCTKQELLIFAKRVYETLIYELGLEAKGAFWKVSDGDNTVYLLGSVHITDGSVYPLSKSIMTAFEESEILAVEANILNMQPDIEYIQKIIMLEGDATIDQLISAETYAAYVEAVQAYGFPPEMYNKIKPWYAAMLLQSMQMSNTTYQASLGIDMFFLSKAMYQKPIVELESIRFQLDMFDSFSAELQEQYLSGVLASGEAETESSMGELVSIWKEGDMEALEEILTLSESASDIDKEFNEKLFITRNNNMSEKVEEMLTGDSENDYFVVVGAGHMLLESGIVNQLIEKGYIVERVMK
ncbi:MAG: TraB/GumN family protein [Bacillota bacterium]